MKADLKLFIIAMSLLLLTGIAVQELSAQTAPDRNHRRDKLESIVIGKFVTELELSPEQSERFFPLFRQFREQSEQIQRRQHQVREELDRASKPNAKAGKRSDNPLMSNLTESSNEARSVDELIGEREQNEQEMIRLRSQFLKNVGDFLTPQQISRCSILLEELPRKIHRMIEQEKRRQHNSGRNHQRPR